MSADDRVRQTVARLMKQDPDTLSVDTKLFADLGMNSATVLHLLTTLERELEIDLDPAALEPQHLETIGSLTEFVLERQGV